MILPAALASIPVDPDAPHARQLLIDELSKPAYQAAKPTWFDLAAAAVRDWFGSLKLPDGHGWEGILAVAGILAVVALVAVAFAVFGAPRRSRRRPVTVALFGHEDVRSAAELRRSASAAAARGDWAAAVCDRYRAVARSLAERTVVAVLPGTTAVEFAADAGAAFPEHAVALRAAARTFDTVRYLDGSAVEADYRQLTGLDESLQHARPRQLATVGAG